MKKKTVLEIIGISLFLTAVIGVPMIAAMEKANAPDYGPAVGGYTRDGTPLAPYSPYEHLVGKVIKFDKIAGEKDSIGVVTHANGFSVYVKCADRNREHTAYGSQVEVIE